MADERVMVFIDGNNLYHSLRSDHGWTDLDFRAFALKLASGRRLIRTYYYNATVDNTKPGSTEPATRFGCRDTQTGAPLKLG